MQSSIPTFASDGKRLRNYSLDSVNALFAADRVAVERNRKGEIVQATFRPASGANPIKAWAYMGRSSSYLQHLPSGRTAWTLCPLVEPSAEVLCDDAERASAESFVREVFLTVPLSLTILDQRAKPVVDIGEYRARTKRLAPVISIDAFRRRRTVAMSRRPIEYDSEGRAA